MPEQTPEELAQLAALTAVGVAVAATPLEVSRRYTRRAFSVLRVAAGLAASADSDIAALGRQLQRIIGGVDLGELGRRQLAAILREISAAVAETYTGLAAAQTAAARQVLAIEAGWAAGVLGGQTPSPGMIARMEQGLLVLGATPADQWQRQGDTLTARVGDAVREGAATGVPVREAVGDIISTAQRDGRALADVTTTSAAAQGRAEVARANGMIGFRWIAVLDSRTTTGCAIRNGLVYSLDYQPVGHSIPIERPPPRHWGCRSILVALRRMPREGDADIDVTFEQWMESLSPAEQDDILGAGRADLWRRGVITKADLISQRGRVLTLAELLARID
jgi:SPP1 gp7 family putative phage head morphogenesis protein